MAAERTSPRRAGTARASTASARSRWRRRRYVRRMPIVPDDKDWTWVLDRPCPECGYVAVLDHAAIAPGLRANAARWPGLLDHPAVALRPDDDHWSALEYACHV